MVVNKSGRQCVQLKIAHTIRAYHHSSLLLIESIDNRLQRLRRRVEIVRVQLYGKTSAIGAVDGLIPASANAQVCTFWHNDVKFITIMGSQH